MNEVEFVNEREPDWQRLTLLCDRAEVSPAALSPEEFHEFVRLYRRVSGDLAKARTKSSNIQLIEFLNNMVARTYGILYRAPRKPIGRALVDAMALSAQTVRRRRWFVHFSTLLLFGSALFAYFLLDHRPEAREYFVVPEMEETFEHWKSGVHEERTSTESVAMTGFYLSNNPFVAILAGSTAAATFGIFTASLLYSNGALLGALAHEVQPVGQLDHLLISISPHGVPELTGIIMSGAAGLCMGWALIHPGRRKRGEALREAGQDAIVLLVTAVILMFIAAPIEGFFSFNPNVPDAAKVLFAAISFVAWIAFWTGYGRTPEEEAARLARQADSGRA